MIDFLILIFVIIALCSLTGFKRSFILSTQSLNCGTFIFDEIETDDYDRDGFVCVENEIEDTTKRPEGYHYKAHYQIKVREFGSMRQGSHRDIKISSCRPKQANGMLIEVVSSLRSGVNSGDIVFVLNGPLF